MGYLINLVEINKQIKGMEVLRQQNKLGLRMKIFSSFSFLVIARVIGCYFRISSSTIKISSSLSINFKEAWVRMLLK